MYIPRSGIFALSSCYEVVKTVWPFFFFFFFFQTGWIYSRWENPTTQAASNTLNNLEGGHGTLLFSSGMAAISNALMAMLKSGDHVVCSAFALIICGFCYVFFFYFLLLWLFLQGPKVHLPGRQFDKKFHRWSPACNN